MPAPSDDSVVEAEIVFDGAFERPTPKKNQNDFGDTLERPTPKANPIEEDEFSNLNDEEINKKAREIVNKAMEEFLEDVFEDEPADNEANTENIDEVNETKTEINDNNEEIIEDNEFIQQETTDDGDVDGFTYYKGSNDVKCEDMCANPEKVKLGNYCILIGEENIKREISKYHFFFFY